jgi:hypothetical protein
MCGSCMSLRRKMQYQTDGLGGLDRGREADDDTSASREGDFMRNALTNALDPCGLPRGS